MSGNVIGFDIGGTKTLGVLVDSEREIRAERKVPRPTSPAETVTQIVGLVHELTADADGPVCGVGVGIAGAISRAGKVHYSPNIPEIVDFDLAAELRDRLDRHIVVDNDANAAAWAEHQIGAGRQVDDLLYVALGTGIGTGMILGGRLYRGAHGFAGESGHIVIDRYGQPHITGVAGPWEMSASGSGLGALARAYARDGQLDSVLELAHRIEAIRGEHVSAATAAGAVDVGPLLDEFATSVAVGLTNLIYVLDPERIVIGGGLVALGEPLRSRIQRTVDETTLGRDHRPGVAVALAELGAKSAARGAAILARQ